MQDQQAVPFCSGTAGPGQGRHQSGLLTQGQQAAYFCVEGRPVQVWRRAGAGQVGSRTISRRSPLCGGTTGPGLVLVRLAHARSAGGPILWPDGWSRSGSDW